MLNKNLLKELVKSFTIEEIEKSFINNYLIQNGLDKNSILKTYFSDFQENKSLISILKYQKFQINSIKELESYLELLIPSKDRKLNGAFFTPNFIIDFIINEVQPKENDKCLDPSCGSGAFLIGLVDYYKSNHEKTVKEIVQKNIYGSDILPYNIKRAKILLSILALENNEYLEENDFNLYCQDSLKANWETKFEVIVGNPPYVKYQDLSDENRAYLLKNWSTIKKGTFNLYFAFFELGYQLLNETGKLGYITPNNYFTSLAGKNLRAFFLQNKCVHRIIDFSHKRVFDAQTYTAITFLGKEKKSSILYDRVKSHQTPQQFVSNANGSPNSIKELNVKKWRLLKTDEQKNIKIIETLGTPIKELFDICAGIATLKDEIFFVDTSQQDEKYFYKTTERGVFKIEKELTKSVYKISEFKKQEDIPNNKRRIIFPYGIKNNGQAEPIKEALFQKKYPNAYKYLLAHKDILDSRDKGKVKYSPFYVWGRTQGLTKTGLKILNPTFSRFPRFLVVEEKDAYFTNGYGIYFTKANQNVPIDIGISLFSNAVHPFMLEENIDVTQKILNSKLMDYYVTKTSVSIAGGYPCYQKNFIEKFTIPKLSKEEIDFLRNENDKFNIDEFLITKYQLNIPVPKRFSYVDNSVSINPS